MSASVTVSMDSAYIKIVSATLLVQTYSLSITVDGGSRQVLAENKDIISGFTIQKFTPPSKSN